MMEFWTEGPVLIVSIIYLLVLINYKIFFSIYIDELSLMKKKEVKNMY